MRILKYPAERHMLVPIGKVCGFMADPTGTLCVWVLTEEGLAATQALQIAMTGEEIAPGWTHLFSTVHGPLVLHLLGK